MQLTLQLFILSSSINSLLSVAKFFCKSLQSAEVLIVLTNLVSSTNFIPHCLNLFRSVINVQNRSSTALVSSLCCEDQTFSCCPLLPVLEIQVDCICSRLHVCPSSSKNSKKLLSPDFSLQKLWWLFLKRRKHSSLMALAITSTNLLSIDIS